MAQQYGFRASNNLSEVLDRNECLDNLGIDRRDLPFLVGTSDAGVVSADYQAIIGLTSNLESQIIALASGAIVASGSFANKASISGDTFVGNVTVENINNDRPYFDAANTIYGPSTASFFSPAASGSFASGAQYKLGPVKAESLTASGVNYIGSAKDWSPYYVRYKQYLTIKEQPSWTTRRSPLYLPPPSSLSSSVFWLDSEFSTFVLNGNQVEQWRTVGGDIVASQTTAASRPLYTASLLNNKPGIVFDGSNDWLNLGNLGYLFPSAATVVVVASIGEPNVRGDADFNLFSTLNNTGVRWRNSADGNGDFGVFSSAVLGDFPRSMAVNGTSVFSTRISQSYGIDFRINGSERGRLSNQPVTTVTYNAGTNYAIGANVNGSAGFLNGTVFAIAAFDTVLSDKELRTIEEYFAWRYDFVYDPDRTQPIELEDGQPLETEGGVSLVLG